MREVPLGWHIRRETQGPERSFWSMLGDLRSRVWTIVLERKGSCGEESANAPGPKERRKVSRGTDPLGTCYATRGQESRWRTLSTLASLHAS